MPNKQPSHGAKNGTRKRSPESRLQAKRAALELGIRRLQKELKLSGDGVYVKIIGSNIVVDAQFGLLKKSQRLPGMPNSEEELDPA